MKGYEFYQDLTYYSLSHFENAKNIGFINIRKGDYKVGKVSEKFKENLKCFIKFATSKIKVGNEELSYKFNENKNHNNTCKINIDGIETTLGYSEIRVIGNNNEVYAAPDKIYYYIEKFGYLPPNEFIEAVENGTSILTKDKNDINPKWQKFFKMYNEDNFYGANEDYINEIKSIENLLKENEEKFKNKVFPKRILNSITKQGSILNLAIEEEKEDIAIYLIKSGIDIKRFSGVELLTAIKKGMNNIVKELVEKRIEMKTYSLEYNPLFYAVKSNNLEAVKMLMGDKKLDIKYKYWEDLGIYEFENCIGTSDNAILDYKGKVINIDIIEYAKKFNNNEEILKILQTKDLITF